MMKTIFIAGPHDRSVEKLFKSNGFEIVEDSDDADAAVFTGGSDIYPHLYGQKPLKHCFFNLKRDLEEIRIFKDLPSGLPKIGICRGAQLFNILCGGSMYQDVDGHERGTHPVKDLVTGRIVTVNTLHHQMMIPGDRAFIVACARESRNKRSDNRVISYTDKGREVWDDPEVIYYENFNCLCFQGHPETGDKECVDYFFSLIGVYFND